MSVSDSFAHVLSGFVRTEHFVIVPAYYVPHEHLKTPSGRFAYDFNRAKVSFSVFRLTIQPLR